jgi:hypothetical protein
VSGDIRALIAFAGSFVMLAALAVLLSPKANSANVITATSGGFANVLMAAESPVTGTS